MAMTRIHVTRASAKPKLKFGDVKIIKGVPHIRCYKTANIGTRFNPCIAYDRTGGRQRVEWIPEDQVNKMSLTRKRELI